MKKPPLSILYVGELWQGSTCLHRMRAMQDEGHVIVPIDVAPEAVRRQRRTLKRRILRRVFGQADLAKANERMLRVARDQSFDIVWIDKGLTARPDTLDAIKALGHECTIVGYSPDDMMNPNNQSRHFLRGLPKYDIYFTTKSYGVSELLQLGCPRVQLIGNAYDPHTHRPLPVSAQERECLGGTLGFIGQWEPERAQSLWLLAESGIDVRVWGYTWERCRPRSPCLRLENKPVWGDAYAQAICAFDINLCFLRKCNRDLQTTRSIEIPACGAFMLAERTDEHLALFEEGKEAEFFGDNEELLDKVKYYLAHPNERKKIATAGHERCVRSGYSNCDRMREMLEIVEQLQLASQAGSD